jgi:ABC transport system ATP-binding/permease protein
VTAPNLELVLPDGVWRVAAGDGTVVLGRDPLCSFVVDDPRVSREHLAIEWRDGGWRVSDLGTRNGTFTATGRVRQMEIVGSCALHLGAVEGPQVTFRLVSKSAPPAATATEHLAPQRIAAHSAEGPAWEPTVIGAPARRRFGAGRVPSATHSLGKRTLIGRTPDNTIVLNDLLVSRHHAKILNTGDGLQLVDLDSRNGTFVNGRRVRTADLRTGDRLSFGHHQLIVDGTTLRDHNDDGRVSLRADGLTVRVGERILLDRVWFDLAECSLLAVVGPSGSGKSTLLGALTGIRPAGAGTVRYADRDLYAEYDDLRHRIGLVPQDDILHSHLTVRRALRYAAALRFGTDVTPAERDARIDDVLGMLGLTAHAHQRISTLSGGQRKRTSVALEMLTEPSLLFLDEPTSGLDPALDRDVMTSLRDLADRGRTVIVVTHSPLHLDICDQVLVLGHGGKVTYLGPPDQLLGFFHASGYADVFRKVADHPDEWAAKYAAAAVTRKTNPETAERRPAAPPPPPRQGWWRQVSILTQRMVALTLADRLYAALTLGLPLGLALLLYLIPGSDGLGRPAGAVGRSLEASQLLVILIIGAAFIGLAGGIRELVGEAPIYRRERAVGLSPGAYLASKLLVFGGLTALQSAMFVLVGLLPRRGPADALVLGSPMVELIAVVWLTAFACTVLGLLCSAFVSTNEQTMPVLVGLVMTQLGLCGGLFTVADRPGIEQLSWLVPARWGFAAAAATVDLRSVHLTPSADALWNHTPHAWVWAMGMLAVHLAVLTVATRLALRRQEPGR